MSTTVDFYLQRAAECAEAAVKTDLVNVRERNLRAEAVWRDMAERLIRVQEKKQTDAHAKATGADDVAAAIAWPIAAPKKKN